MAPKNKGKKGKKQDDDAYWYCRKLALDHRIVLNDVHFIGTR